jgi:hypothetical protein
VLESTPNKQLPGAIKNQVPATTNFVPFVELTEIYIEPIGYTLFITAVAKSVI